MTPGALKKLSPSSPFSSFETSYEVPSRTSRFSPYAFLGSVYDMSLLHRPARYLPISCSPFLLYLYLCRFLPVRDSLCNVVQ